MMVLVKRSGASLAPLNTQLGKQYSHIRLKLWPPLNGLDNAGKPRAPFRAAQRSQRHAEDRQQVFRIVGPLLQTPDDLADYRRLVAIPAMDVEQHRCPQKPHQRRIERDGL